jgi:hypothetical protein
MELKFKLATEPAVKATIAIVACCAITHVATHLQNLFGIASSIIIGVLGVVIETYKTPPLCALCSN